MLYIVVCSFLPFKLDYTGFGILIFGYGKDSVRSDMAYPILYLVSFVDTADTKPIEQIWKTATGAVCQTQIFCLPDLT